MAGCANNSNEDCEGEILDLEISSFDDSSNRIIDFLSENKFRSITDSIELIRFEEPNRVSYFFQKSAVDSTKLKFQYLVKEAIIQTEKFQWDLLALVVNDEELENVYYTLKSYSNDREQVGHLDFAHWSGDNKTFVSGRIDCDSSLHMILNQKNEHRVFKTDAEGKNSMIEKKTIN
jgi:hypothetical protein